MADSTRRVSVRLSLGDAARVKQELREVGETGQCSLERIQGGADRASRALDLLDVAVRGVQIAGLAAGLRAVVVAGDALTQSMGRLNTALGSVERAGEIYDRLYRDSLQTGVAVRESVDAFARFSIAAREIGATSDQVATLVGGLQRIAIASGASQQEIAFSTQQLVQALARKLGVSIGELRKPGSEGKLTADTVFPALLRAVERLNGEIERAPLSVGRAFGQLTAAADQFLARLDQAIGLSNALARALSGAARVLDGVSRVSGLLLPSEQEADRRAEAEALRAQIARLEAESDGRDSLRSQPRRGSIQGGLVGTAQQQAGVDRAARLEELRRQYSELQEEITRGEQAAGERQRTEQEAAAGQAAEARRRRTAADAEELRKALDDRFRINSEYEDRVRRLREAEAAGGITAADRTRLETLALRERDEALRRIEGTTRRVAAIPRLDREAEREINDIIRERERLIQNNENAQVRYTRRLETLGRLVDRSERIGQPIPDETISREANAALEELERSQQRVQQATERTSNTARELGLTFSSAFEDAIIKGESFSKVLQGILQDIARIVVRRTITEPLGTAVTSSLSGFDFGSIFSGIGSALGGLFRAEGGPVAGGQPYIVGERGPEWFVPNRSGTVLPNGMAPNGLMGGGPVINRSITIDARGADAGVEARLRVLSAQIVRQASATTLDAIRRGGSATSIVRG
ncbi:tape measure protein [Falsiroseomonas sp. E2-1-a20]|uniref:tape measure protein n=1 Tax=Falsiroseomonas sp. E2-1-a20 TaxID=3239300 RepID=UPI003F363809